MSGHPIMLGISSSLMLISAISGFVGYGKVSNAEIKKMLMSAALLSLLSALLLGVGMILVHRGTVNMNTTFSLILLVLAGLLILVSGIIYAAAAAKIREQQNKAGHVPTVLASTLSFISLVVMGIIFVLALLAIRKKQPEQIGLVGVPPTLVPSYGAGDSAEEQLKQLRTGASVQAGTPQVGTPQSVGIQ